MRMFLLLRLSKQPNSGDLVKHTKLAVQVQKPFAKVLGNALFVDSADDDS